MAEQNKSIDSLAKMSYCSGTNGRELNCPLENPSLGSLRCLGFVLRENLGVE